jgi:Uma2 family endonuclease
MSEAGVFEGRRVELLEGEVIEMTPQGSRHASAVASIVTVLVRALSPSFSIRPQLPLALDDRSEPEPDVAVCRPDPRNYADAHPCPAHVVLLVEVADTSLPYDRDRKAAVYARAGIPALWIVDLRERAVTVFSEPDRVRGRYGREQRVAEGGELVLPDRQSVRTSDLLPPA